ncbi:MAG: ATP-binding protein [Acidobacteriota bacterium]|nr:ATP-binding protein [Acidobacteriota bacterium]
MNSYTAALALNALIHNETPVAILDSSGKLLAERPPRASSITPPPTLMPAEGEIVYYTFPGAPSGEPGPRRIGVGAFKDATSHTYYISVSQPLESLLSELHTARLAFLITVPILLALTGFGGWMLTGHSFAPATAMSNRARRINAENLNERILVTNPRDELGRLAASFNELLDRVAAASIRERQFMADAAHELRTPISVIQTATTVMLSSENRSKEEYRSALSTIDVYARRLSRNVDDVFRLARADAGFKSIQLQGLYLNEVLLEAARAARVLASDKNITIQTEGVNEAPYDGDEALLGEMILNLLENAIKYTRAGGLITIRLESSTEQYSITISDNGVGISANHQAHIFDRFYRAQPIVQEGTGKSEGSGMGLAIALWIATSHKGILDLQSSDECGSTFRVVLPRV